MPHQFFSSLNSQTTPTLSGFHMRVFSWNARPFESEDSLSLYQPVNPHTRSPALPACAHASTYAQTDRHALTSWKTSSSNNNNNPNMQSRLSQLGLNWRGVTQVSWKRSEPACRAWISDILSLFLCFFLIHPQFGFLNFLSLVLKRKVKFVYLLICSRI